MGFRLPYPYPALPYPKKSSLTLTLPYNMRNAKVRLKNKQYE
jgi:hypothetical protein